jgi:hypothetical protein
MQLLLLAISIITLTLIAGNNREKTSSLENSRVSMEMEKPAINNVDCDLPADKPSVFISRFEMFVN